MSLNWDCKALTDAGFNIWTTKPGVPDEEQVMNPVTEALIWATLAVGCDGRRIDTFIQRIREYEIAAGPLVRWPAPDWTDRAIEANYIRPDSENEDGYISRAELLRHKGFTTNVTFKTDAEWAKHLRSIIKDDAAHTLNKEPEQ